MKMIVMTMLLFSKTMTSHKRSASLMKPRKKFAQIKIKLWLRFRTNLTVSLRKAHAKSKSRLTWQKGKDSKN